MFFIAVFSVFVIIIYMSYFLKYSDYVGNLRNKTHQFMIPVYLLSKPAYNSHSTDKGKLPKENIKYLSYQPPGNGWNNQRIAIETALVLAKLLQRNLIVHPLSSHHSSEKMKLKLPQDTKFGYLTYNKMSASNLLKVSEFLDLELMSKVVPVTEVDIVHKKFVQKYSNLSWSRICHSMGYGYWIDRHAATEEERQYVSKQVFTPNESWKSKCPEEAKESKLNNNKHIIRYVSDLVNDTSDIVYFSEGTLFGIQIRFMTLEATRRAQEWILGHVKYRKEILKLSEGVSRVLGIYNAIHVRRIGHQTRQLTPGSWIIEMLNKDFTVDVPVYVATDELNLSWFDPIKEAGFKLYFAANFSSWYDLTRFPTKVRQDLLGMHEQMVCVQARKFVPSLHSTFSSYILRERGEIEMKDGLYMNVLHTAWVEHTIS